MLPPEIIQNILFYCDFRTLRTAIDVHPDWKELVCANAKKRCQRDIPGLHLLDLQLKWAGSECAGYWVHLYDNWSSWQDIAENIDLTSAEFHRELEDITCISTLGDYVAVGLGNGHVKIYDHVGTLKNVFQNLDDDDDDEVLKVHFVPDSLNASQPSGIIIAYEDIILVRNFNGSLSPAIIQTQYHTKTLSAFKNYIALVTKQDVFLVMQAPNTRTNQTKSVDTVLSLPLEQSSCTLRKTSLSQNSCCVLTNDTLKIIYYKPRMGDGSPILGHIVDKKIRFSVPPHSMCRQYAWIFYSEIVVHICYDMDSEEEILELILLDNKTGAVNAKKFNIWHTLRTLVYVVYLHGNTLVLGCANGALLFYNVKDWRQFNAANYATQRQLPATFGPIRSIDVVECCGERTFYVSGNMDVYKVNGKRRAPKL